MHTANPAQAHPQPLEWLDMSVNRVFRSSVTCVLTLTALFAPAAANAEVDLECRPAVQTVQFGDLVQIGLYALDADPNDVDTTAAMDVIIGWDPSVLRLEPIDTSGSQSWLAIGFLNDPYNINESNPPQDGDAMLTAFAFPGLPVHVSPAGIRVTTLRWTAIRAAESTSIQILESAGSPVGRTVVYDGTVPNLDITGDLRGAEVTIECGVCPEDITRDGFINLEDLAILLSNYGTVGVLVPGDIDCDGDVDLEDLAVELAVYGTPCD